MSYTALQLINRAYFLSQVVSRNLQTTTGDQASDGLYMLNALLDVKSMDLHLIPYFTEYEFDTIASTESYWVPNLLYVDSMTFNIGTVRYSMEEMTRKGYFSTPRVDDVYSLPFSYRVERGYYDDIISTAAGTTTLTSSSNSVQYLTGSTTQTILLPVTSTLSLDDTFTIVNNSTGIVTVQSSGADTVLAMNGNTAAIYTCISTTGTTAASWSYAATDLLSATGAYVYLYFVPDQAYTVKIWGKFGLTDVTLTTDLSTLYDNFYLEYLRYALADYICGEWGVTFPDASKRRLAEYMKKLKMVSPPDLSIQKRTYFGSKPGLDWQLVNIPGWIPY